MTASDRVVPFVKANACGNDFLIIDGSEASADVSDFTRRICDRHRGVGADGVEWLFPDPDADVRAQLFNADGSEAEISGNGTRCVAAYLCSEQRSQGSSLEPKEEFAIRTGAGIKTCSLIGRNASTYEFETAMGEPEIGEELQIRLPSRDVMGIPVSMGNPHYVVFVEEFSSNWQAEAAEVGSHPDFNYGVNVELVLVKDKSNVEVRFFERGVGETQSSGTGSCAAAVATISAGHALSPVRVHAAGGTQIVRWEGQVFLRGPVTLVCRGEYFI